MKSQLQNLLFELIALRTVNPAFAATGATSTGEKPAMEYLAATAAKAGLCIELQEALPDRPNLLVRLLPRAKTKYRVILAPHLDTVDGSPEQFTPRVRHGRIYGRGACDTKGSVAAMFRAVLELTEGRRRPEQTEILFAGFIDEENMQVGSRALAQTGIRVDLAIVGEATELKVVTAHKGDVWLHIETQGRSAHGSKPELGVNAVHKMAAVVELLETEYAAGLKRRPHPVLGPATSNVGSIAGGTQANIVPERCVISVDRRTLPGESEQSVLREVKGFLRSKGLKAQVSSYKQAPCLPLDTDVKEPFVARLLESVGQVGGAGVDYFCDASVLSKAGIPSVVFGPGNIAQAHTADEWISIRSLEQAQRMLLRFLQDLP